MIINKKGSILDIMFYAIIMFMLALFIILAYKIMGIINDEFQSKDELSSTAKTILSEKKTQYVNLFDGIWITVFILFALVIAVGAYFIYMHPVFFVPSLFVIIFLIIVAAVLTNVFSDITESDDLRSEKNEFSIISFVMGSEGHQSYYMPWIVILSFLIIMASYAKYKQGGE